MVLLVHSCGPLQPQPNTWFLKRAAGIKKGTPLPGKQMVGTITLKQLYHIAEIKQVICTALPSAHHCLLLPFVRLGALLQRCVRATFSSSP